MYVCVCVRVHVSRLQISENLFARARIGGETLHAQGRCSFLERFERKASESRGSMVESLRFLAHTSRERKRERKRSRWLISSTRHTACSHKGRNRRAMMIRFFIFSLWTRIAACLFSEWDVNGGDSGGQVEKEFHRYESDNFIAIVLFQRAFP